MVIPIFFTIHWYASLFFQSLFNHRYSAHQMFTMTKFWEKMFFVGSWITNGSSYLSPKAYGILHRMHHAFADTEKDPHSPKYDPNPFAMMWKTKNIFTSIERGKLAVEEKFKKNIPTWDVFDKFAGSWGSRIVWGAGYVVLWFFFATAWWQWLLLPFTFVIGPVHGVVINWIAHVFGYRNYETADTSRNVIPVDVVMWGECLHNNHHKYSTSANFAKRWYEVDFGYFAVRALALMRIIKLGKNKGVEETEKVNTPLLKKPVEESVRELN